MNVAGSLFSGIGGLDEGLRRAGWDHAFLCESDAYRRDVLRTRFPGVPVYEDVRSVRRLQPSGNGGRNEDASADGGDGSLRPIDLLSGGFPCQDLSVAGRRAGLDGERSGLFYEFARIAESLRPRWLLVENVPGLLSSNGGRDFGELLGTLADIGYGLGWRVLDSRFFGVPQRRRRVYIVGVFADGDPRAAAERAGEVLAVGQGCARHSKARGEAGQDAPVASFSGLGSGGPDDNDGQGGRLVDVAYSLRRDPGGTGQGHNTNYVAAPLSHGSNPNSNMAGRRREDDENLVPYGLNTNRGGNADVCLERDATPPITNSHGNPGGVLRDGGVRRLTPTECERLQALPDDWTQLGDTPDSRRYAALGDAVTASVSEWIGRRLLDHVRSRAAA